MKFRAEIDNVRTLKRGMKITIAIRDKEAGNVLKNMYNFMDKPITVEFLVDDELQAERLKQLSPEQRRKIYAILRDMEAYIGDSVENLKEKTKESFIRATEYEDFSLSNCSRELAADYIEYLLTLCFEMGVPFSNSPADAFEDVARYLRLCLAKKVCAVCWKRGEVHHADAIGMGRDRRTVDDLENRKICLCRGHHSEAHQSGMNAFESKYHVHGVVWEG
mgnify:CR=1 FL=1